MRRNGKRSNHQPNAEIYISFPSSCLLPLFVFLSLVFRGLYALKILYWTLFLLSKYCCLVSEFVHSSLKKRLADDSQQLLLFLPGALWVAGCCELPIPSLDVQLADDSQQLLLFLPGALRVAGCCELSIPSLDVQLVGDSQQFVLVFPGTRRVLGFY